MLVNDVKIEREGMRGWKRGNREKGANWVSDFEEQVRGENQEKTLQFY